MRERSKTLADRLNSFNQEVISFVESCTEDDWQKIGAEDWPVGVTARHIAAVHYPGVYGAKKILKGEKFPAMTMAQIVDNANRHAKEHAACTKSEVLSILRNEGSSIGEFVGSLEDSDLDKVGYLPALGSDLTVEQFIQAVILRSANEHLQSMKAAAGK
jgi:hypothetical protein